MTGLVKLKKYFEKVSHKLLFIIWETYHVLTLASFCAVITLVPSWFMLGVQPLGLDQIIFFIAVLSANIMAFRFPVWFPSRSRFVEVFCEVINFSLSEIAVFVPTALNLFWNSNDLKEFVCPTKTNTNGNRSTLTICIMLLSCYVVVFPLVNTIIHSEFIQQLMRKSKHSLAAYSADVKGGYAIVGLTLLYGSMLGVLDISQLNVGALLILLLQATTILMIQMHLQTYMEIVKRMNCPRLINTHSYHFIVFIAMMPLLTSIVIVSAKYGAVSLVNEIKHVAGEIKHMTELKQHQESPEFAELSIFWSIGSAVIMSICGSLIRDGYLITRLSFESQ